MPRSKTIKDLEKELWILNADERLKAHEKEIELLKGNLNELWKMFKALEKHKGVKFMRVNNYYKNK